MNIVEAIKSGRRFKRPSWATFCMSSDMLIAADGYYKIRHDYLLADDWEVEEVSCYAGSAMITREQFNSAWHKIVYCHDAEREDMLKELGL